MNGVIGIDRSLLDTKLDEEQRDYTTTVQRCAGGLLSMIDDTLIFRRMEAGKLTLERVDFLLFKEMEDVAHMLTEAAERKQIELICD